MPPPRPRTAEDVRRRQVFLKNLHVLDRISLANDVDYETPSENFVFINESVLGDGVELAPTAVLLGCTCSKGLEQPEGCIYLDSCTCIEDAADDEFGQKSIPYGSSESDLKCLKPVYLESRNHLFECNDRCDCSKNCKNRVVQHGRQVWIEIFKTRDRGWGLRCKQDLKMGQFIDTYRGEIITTEEADSRGKDMTGHEANYFFSFDKFKDTPVFDPSREYVCDGSNTGSPARFINHSCDPNCRIFTVSYNHNDRNIYDLAFFALENIPQGTELTFNYYNDDDEEQTIITDEMADEIEADKGYRPTRCLCGSQRCRRYFFN